MVHRGDIRENDVYRLRVPAIPTKDANLRALPLAQIKKFVSQFQGYAQQHPELRFLVTEIGCGLAGYLVYEMAPLFERCPANCELPDEFVRVLKENEV